MLRRTGLQAADGASVDGDHEDGAATASLLSGPAATDVEGKMRHWMSKKPLDGTVEGVKYAGEKTVEGVEAGKKKVSEKWAEHQNKGSKDPAPM